MRKRSWFVARQLFLGLGVALALGGMVRADDEPANPTKKKETLPAFSEEREAAALHFVNKHVPELKPILEKLKAADAGKYRTEIREIFQVTEWLSDLQE